MKRGLKYFASIAMLALSTNCTNTTTDSGKTDNIESLVEWLATPSENRAPIESCNFSTKSITKEEAKAAKELIVADKQAAILKEYGQEWDSRLLTYGNYKMPFFYQIFGEKPADGRSLFISMHGGGGTTPEANDKQYSNQQHLYDATMKDLEGVYLAPRAATNTWNLWHEKHIDEFMNIIIQMAIIKEGVDPNKVYIMGYSAGGDGTYQLAPRMADRWAAGAMMAGHPNDASALNLKNTPFTIHMGALDSSFRRDEIAAEWGVTLDSLESSNPGSYIHEVEIHEGKGHWMKLEDSVALPWVSQYRRNPCPSSITWVQDDIHHNSFYWVGVDEASSKTGDVIRAEYNREGNEIEINCSNSGAKLNLYINDTMLDLDSPITVKRDGKVIKSEKLSRTILSIYRTAYQKGDSNLTFPCTVTL